MNIPNTRFWITRIAGGTKPLLVVRDKDTVYYETLTSSKFAARTSLAILQNSYLTEVVVPV